MTRAVFRGGARKVFPGESGRASARSDATTPWRRRRVSRPAPRLDCQKCFTERVRLPRFGTGRPAGAGRVRAVLRDFTAGSYPRLQGPRCSFRRRSRPARASPSSTLSTPMCAPPWLRRRRTRPPGRRPLAPEGLVPAARSQLRDVHLRKTCRREIGERRVELPVRKAYPAEPGLRVLNDIDYEIFAE